jgi:hypothetical protein
MTPARFCGLAELQVCKRADVQPQTGSKHYVPWCRRGQGRSIERTVSFILKVSQGKVNVISLMVRSRST